MKRFPHFLAVALFSVSLSSGAAHVHSAYECEAKIPLGKASLEVRAASEGSSELFVEFENDYLGQVFSGAFEIDRFDEEYLLAAGELRSSGTSVPASIRLDFEAEGIFGALSARDSRIDLGFGNTLICSRVEE